MFFIFVQKAEVAKVLIYIRPYIKDVCGNYDNKEQECRKLCKLIKKKNKILNKSKKKNKTLKNRNGETNEKILRWI